MTKEEKEAEKAAKAEAKAAEKAAKDAEKAAKAEGKNEIESQADAEDFVEDGNYKEAAGPGVDGCFVTTDKNVFWPKSIGACATHCRKMNLKRYFVKF
jgi:membrane protein involved in colicin uptake